MKWTSVKEQMPPKDTLVLCYYYAKYIETMEYWFDDEITGKAQFCNCSGGGMIDDVTHWMPLPKPPEENNDEK